MKLMFYKSTGDGLGWFVKTIEGARYSHCEVLFSDGVSISSVANEGLGENFGVRRRIINYNSDWDVMELPHTPSQEELCRAYAEGALGKYYDIASLLLYLPTKLRLDPNAFICSEFCERVIRYGAMYWPNFAETLKSPSALADALIAQGLYLEPYA